MNEVCVRIARLALVLDLLPWGSNSRGMGKLELANALGQRGIRIHPDSLLRDLKAWQDLFELQCSRDENGTTYWKRSSRRHSISHLLDLEDFTGDAIDECLNSNHRDGLDEHGIPDFPSDIIFRH
ncbi:MAG: hypothetical protein RQ729_11295 [Wenzhouxiangellaceae bacterium]|nr:hypothetical protein [Wenzhouxiangellaceae bacterium]